MQVKNRQKGATSVIIVFILIVVISSMLGVALTSSRSGLSSVNSQNNAAQATYLAESALERVVYNLNTNPSCTGLVTPDQQTLNNGTYEITSAAISTTDSVECNIQVKGVMNGIVRYINTKIFNNGGAGGGAGTDFQEQFPSNADFNSNWTEIIINGRNDGTSRWDPANCPASICPGSLGGTFYVETNGFGGNRRMQGYRERVITNPVNTGSGLTVTITGAWLKRSSTGGIPRRQVLKIQLYDSSAGSTKLLWRDTTKSGNSGIRLINTTVNLQGNRTYDRVRLFFNFTGRQSGGIYVHPQAYMDEISITGISGGGAAPDWQVVEWQEVSN